MIGDDMEQRKDEEKISVIKKVAQKTPQILKWISGVGSQKYSVEFVKKGY